MNKMTTESTEDPEARGIRKKLNDLTQLVIGAAIDVHRALGPGLLESAYEICLCRELSLREIQFRRQLPIPLEYKGVKLDCGYRSDIIVEEILLLELKAVDALLPIHEAQLLSYLKLTGLSVGLLINFNVEVLKEGIRRRVLNSGSKLFNSVSSASSVVR
jgi:GxxExxY protein